MIKFRNFIVINLFLIIILVSTKSFSENHNVLEVLELIQKDLKTLEKAVYSGSFNDNLSWLLYLFNQVKNQKNINWIIKEHPSDVHKKVKKGTKYYFKKLINNNNVKLFPKNYNARSLKFIVNLILLLLLFFGFIYLPFLN